MAYRYHAHEAYTLIDSCGARVECVALPACQMPHSETKPISRNLCVVGCHPRCELKPEW